MTNVVYGGAQKTALHIAALEGCQDIVGLLITYGSDVNARRSTTENFCTPRYGTTALHCALAHSHESVAQMLISENALLEHADFPVQPLHYAAIRGLTSAARTLLEKRVNVDVATCGDTPGLTPLYLASENGRHIMVKMLLEWAPCVDKECGNHGAALSTAVSGGHDLIVQVLLHAGAKPSLGILSTAWRTRNKRMVEILLPSYENFIKLALFTSSRGMIIFVKIFNTMEDRS